MSFNVSRRTMQIGIYKNLYYKKGDTYASGLDLPVMFTMKEKDVATLIPTPEHKEDTGEQPFFSFVEFAFDADGRFLHPYLSPMQIHRAPSELDVTLWPNPDDERQKFTVNSVKAKKLVYMIASGAGQFGSLSCILEIRGLQPNEYTTFINMQKQSRDIAIKATMDDLFAPPPAAEEDPEQDEEQQELPGVPAADADSEGGGSSNDDDDPQDDDAPEETAPPQKPKKSKKKTAKKKSAKK